MNLETNLIEQAYKFRIVRIVKRVKQIFIKNILLYIYFKYEGSIKQEYHDFAQERFR